MTAETAEALVRDAQARHPHLRIWALDPCRDGAWEVRARNPRTGRVLDIVWGWGWAEDLDRFAREGTP